MIIIGSIDKQVFHQLLSPKTTSAIASGDEVEWFADRNETVLGVVCFGGQNRGWGYATLKRDTSKGFRVWLRQEHFSTRHTARIMLLRQMSKEEAVMGERLAA
jgi:hypothetical protein